METLHHDFKEYTRKVRGNSYVQKDVFSKRLHKITREIRKIRKGKISKHMYYLFPSLEKCREFFDQKLGGELDYGDREVEIVTDDASEEL